MASFALAAPIPAENLQRALNRTLPPAIRVLEARTVPSTFHARHSAVAKTYEYRVFRGAICPPFLAPLRLRLLLADGRGGAAKGRRGYLRASTIF